MYKKKIKVLNSKIEGKGVFANENISKGETVWIFENDHDLKITQNQFDELNKEGKENLEKIGYLSPWSGLWVYPPEGDLAKYTNHSKNNNLSAIFDASTSSEPYFVANRDIKEGEEITNDYKEFDELTRETKPDWAT